MRACFNHPLILQQLLSTRCLGHTNKRYASNQWKGNYPFNVALLLSRSCVTFFFNFCPPSQRADPGQPCSGNGRKSGGLPGPRRRLEKRLSWSWSWSKCTCGAKGTCDLPSRLCWARVMSLPSLSSCSECNYEQMGKWHDSTANELPYWGRGQCITLLYFRLLIIILRVWCGLLCLVFFYPPSIIITHLRILNSFMVN